MKKDVYTYDSFSLESQGGFHKKKSKYIVIGSLVTLIALIIAGIVVGIKIFKGHDFGNSGSSSGSSSNSQSNAGDPSNFTKDPRLKQSFYRLAYTPEGVQLPNCGANLQDVITDIQLLSQLTTRIRLYGADCNQTSLVLDAIQQTKVNMSVYVGNYPVATDNGTAYYRQRDELKAAITAFGVDNVAGMTVGNEFILDYVTGKGSSNPNSAVGDAGAAILLPYIQDTRSMLASLNLPKTLPVGTADAGAFFNTKILQNVDYGMSNVHAWFANVSAQNSAGWVAEFFQQNNVAAANAVSNRPAMYIAETGWPTQSSDVSNESNGPSKASEANLQIFLDTFVCQANKNGTGYFFFEYFDEPWKNIQFGGVEGWWGLFHSNRTLKNIEIPDCTSS